MPTPVLLTRPLVQSEGFAARLEEEFGAQVAIVISPVLEIEYLPLAVDAGQADAFVFTSRNGVRAASRAGLKGRAFCVGDATARAAQEAGFEAKSAAGDVTALEQVLREQAAGLDLVHISGAHIVRPLQLSSVRRVIAYRQEPMALSDAAQRLLDQGQVVVPLFSPRSARLFSEGRMGGQCQLICLSDQVAASLEVRDADQVTICDHPNADAMIAKLREIVTAPSG